MENQIRYLRNRTFVDKVDNPILDEFEIDKLDTDKQVKAKKIQDNESFLLLNEESEENNLEKYLIESGINEFYKDLDRLKASINEIIRQISANDFADSFLWGSSNMLQKIDKFFIGDNLDIIGDNEIKRLNNEQAQNYYENFIRINRKKSLNENVISQVSYFQEKANSSEPKLYFGKSYGDVDIEPGGNNLSFIDLREKSAGELVNLAIVKLKMEDDFVSFKLNKFIVMLYDFELISRDEYNLYIYGTTDNTKIALSKYGLNIGLITKLEEDQQLGNLTFDDFNNLKATPAFYEYLEGLNDFLRFEIRRFL
jgi:hypothetical protein